MHPPILVLNMLQVQTHTHTRTWFCSDLLTETSPPTELTMLMPGQVRTHILRLRLKGPVLVFFVYFAVDVE